MNNSIIIKNLGYIEYKEAWDLQKQLFEELTQLKAENLDGTTLSPTNKNYLLFCEHAHVYTLGRNGSEENLLINALQLKAKQASFYHIDRGGDVTYHGPGQIVGYPILDLDNFGLSNRDYIAKLEETVILLLAEYGITATRMESAAGVWLDADLHSARKICAIGIRSSRRVTMHGFALNVNTNLEYFSYINPCGFTDKSVTSMQRELGKELDMNEVQQKLQKHLLQVFAMEVVQ